VFHLASVFRLDYLSCLLTVLSTVLVGRKRWTGLALAGVNSGIFCVIGLRTSQFGFIPANLFCIVIYLYSIRSWKRERVLRSTPESERVDQALGERLAA
jgi:nicotinamide riboside transporter PnuC